MTTLQVNSAELTHRGVQSWRCSMPRLDLPFLSPVCSFPPPVHVQFPGKKFCKIFTCAYLNYGSKEKTKTQQKQEKPHTHINNNNGNDTDNARFM